METWTSSVKRMIEYVFWEYSWQKKSISYFLYINLQGSLNWHEKHNQALNLVSKLISHKERNKNASEDIEYSKKILTRGRNNSGFFCLALSL